MPRCEPQRLAFSAPATRLATAMCQKHQLIVLDQNVLRDSNALSAALDRCCRERLQLLIPDVAGFELSKGSQQLDTWRQSLGRLAGYREFVTVSRKLTGMLKEETRTGQPCESLVDSDATTAMRELLDSLDHGDTASLVQMVNGPIRSLMPASLAAWDNSEQHKQEMIRLRDKLRCMMTEKALKRLRKSPEEGIPDWLSSVDGIRFVFQGIKLRGVANEASVRLSSEPSVSAAFISAFAAVALYWLALGGLDGASPEKLTNDLLDMEYAIVGSLSVGFLSKDKRASAVCEAMSMASRERRAWFRWALGEI